MTAQQMWEQFIAERSIQTDRYTVWAFGAEADLLAELTLQGDKTATASAYPLYAVDNEPLPQVGQYNVILNSKEQAVCIVQTTKVYVTPFDKVSPEHAYKEGEGDKSLQFWRAEHEKIFAQWMQDAGLQFTPDMDVVCEEFALVYKPE